jgi:chromosomal replication initiation ATPase DnaA
MRIWQKRRMSRKRSPRRTGPLNHGREANFRTWLAPTRAISQEGNILRIGVPRQFHADWINLKLRSRIQGALQRLGYGNLQFEIVVAT